MASIFDVGFLNIDTLVSDYESLLGNVASSAHRLREQLVSAGRIKNFAELSNESAAQSSLCAIDGASASEKMMTGDILVAGASLHDGAYSKRLYPSPRTAPSSGFASILMHQSRNDATLSALRACSELSVLGASADYDISLIDGAYLGNLLTFIYALQDSYESAQVVLNGLASQNELDNVVAGIRRLLDTRSLEKTKKRVASLAKSDSSRQLVKKYLGGDVVRFATDKVFAGYILQPGEYLSSALVTNNESKRSIFEYVHEIKQWRGFRWQVTVASPQERKILEAIFTVGEGGSSYDELWSLYQEIFEEETYCYTYLKPTMFSQDSHALRLEFTMTNAEKDADVDIAGDLASHISKDVFTPSIKEPHCQYMVDKMVKQPVSSSITYIVSKLSSASSEHTLLKGLTGSYRS